MERPQWKSVKTWEKQNIIVVQPHLKLAAWSCVSRSGSSCSKLDTERTWAAASVPKHFKWMALFAMLKKTYPVPAYTKKTKTQLQSFGCRFPDRKVATQGKLANYVHWISRCKAIVIVKCHLLQFPIQFPPDSAPSCQSAETQDSARSKLGWTQGTLILCVTPARQTCPHLLHW